MDIPDQQHTTQPNSAAMTIRNTQKRRNGNIITMLYPSHNILYGWSPEVFNIHCNNVGIEVGKAILCKIAKALEEPAPRFPSIHHMRHIMMKHFWRRYTINDIIRGICGPTIQQCYHDVIAAEETTTEIEIQDRITIQMTKTTHQDSPPHYHVADVILLERLIRGLIKEIDEGIHTMGHLQQARTIKIVPEIEPGDITPDTNCITEIRPHSRTITLWTRLDLADISTESSIERRSKRNRLAHRENDRPP